MGIQQPWTAKAPYLHKYPNACCCGLSRMTKGHVQLIHQWGDRGPLVEGYLSRRLHLFGCFFAYIQGTLLWQWELWANFTMICLPFFAAVVWYKEPEHHYLFHCVEILHTWVSGYAQFMLGLYISLVLKRYFDAFDTFMSTFGSTQNLALSVSSLLQPAHPEDVHFEDLKKKLCNWINLGWSVMACQNHFRKEEWVGYLHAKGFMTEEEWTVLAPMNKYDRCALVYKWIDRALQNCAQTGRMLYPETSLIKIMDRVATARGDSISFDLGWNVQLPYAYVVFISAMVKLLLICEATLLGMEVHLAPIFDEQNGVDSETFPTWFVVTLQVLFVMTINMVLYSALSLQALLENPWGSAVHEVFVGNGQHASQLPFEELTALLEQRVLVLFDEALCHDVLRPFRLPPVAPSPAHASGRGAAGRWQGNGAARSPAHGGVRAAGGEERSAGGTERADARQREEGRPKLRLSAEDRAGAPAWSPRSTELQADLGHLSSQASVQGTEEDFRTVEGSVQGTQEGSDEVRMQIGRTSSAARLAGAARKVSFGPMAAALRIGRSMSVMTNRSARSHRSGLEHQGSQDSMILMRRLSGVHTPRDQL